MTTQLTPISEKTIRAKIARFGLMPTKQRVVLGAILFKGYPRHVTADSLYDECLQAGVTVSVSTVYNVLRQFVEAGMLKELLGNASRVTYDTNTHSHPHFVDENGIFIDIPQEQIAFASLPPAPAGYDLGNIDIFIQLKPRETSETPIR